MLEEREARVVWEPVVHFDRDPDPDNPRDHGDRPYEPGPSLMDRERRGALSIEHNTAWLGGLQLHASDGDHTVDLMIDRAQAERLIEGLRRWYAGVLADWLSNAESRSSNL